MSGLSLLVLRLAAARLSALRFLHAKKLEGLPIHSVGLTSEALKDMDNRHRAGLLTPPPAPRRAIKRRGDMGRWPIFWRSTKPLRFRPSLGILMGIAFVAFCYVAAVIGEYDHVGVHAFFLTAMLCVLAALLSVLSATAVSGEWQQRTLGVLLCTPITSARIVLEKLLGVLWRLRWLYAVILRTWTCSVRWA